MTTETQTTEPETMIATARADGYEDGLDGTADVDAYDPSQDGTVPAHLWEAARLAYSEGAAEGERAGGLVPEALDGAYCVQDPSTGARWWPNDETAEEIATARDPQGAALQICTSEPMRGRWVA